MSMTSDELYLDTLITQAEQNNLEFKAAKNSFDTETAISYCAAIANEGGGHLILGVSDRPPRVVGGSNAIRNPAELEHRIFEKLKIKVSIRELEYSSKRVVIFVIPSRQTAVPIEQDGRFLMRAGESLVSMSAHRIADILSESKGPVGSRPVGGDRTPSEIESLLDIEAYFGLLPDTRPATLDERIGVLKRRGLVADSGVGGLVITTLGALFLARSLDDFPELRMRRVRFIRYSGADRVNAVFEHYETKGYGLAFEDLVTLIASHTPIRETIEGGLRSTIVMFPPTAVREFLANALIHQDLTEDSVQLTVEIFVDRLEIRNPGEPLIDATRFVDETRSRNPDLAEIMRLARICEVRGSGIDRAVQQIEDYLQPAPTFKKETAATTITMFDHIDFAEMTIDERVWSTFLHCSIRYESSDRLTNTSLRERFGLDDGKTTLVSQTIAAAIDAGLIKLDPRVGRSRRLAKYVPYFA
jgi:ATP-dependent DNA helicase RecG